MFSEERKVQFYYKQLIHFDPVIKVEAELAELTVEERVEYLQSLGVNESGLGNLIRVTYDLLGLRTYFTTGEKVIALASSNL